MRGALDCRAADSACEWHTALALDQSRQGTALGRGTDWTYPCREVASALPAGERKVGRFGWTFSPCDKVMQIENDYDKEVYNRDIGYVKDVEPAFRSSGIDIDRLVVRNQQDDVKQKLITDTNDAVARGAFGSPTFFVGSEMFFGEDQLRDVEESIVLQSSSREAKRA
jgi:ATP-dependent RecD-like DNA helicase SH3 domain/DSBA-like thioredoxin domain